MAEHRVRESVSVPAQAKARRWPAGVRPVRESCARWRYHSVSRASLRPASGADLEERRRPSLLLKNRQGLLQARDLSLAAALALSVRLWLRDAHWLELLPVLHDSIILLHSDLLVLLETRKHGLGLLRVLHLVLHRGLLLRRGDRIVLAELLILLHGHGLGRVALGEQLGEVALNNLEHADDTRGGARGLGVLARALAHPALKELFRRIVLLGVVIPEHLERHANALEALLIVRLRRRPCSGLLHAHLRRLLLRRGDFTELLLERRNLLLQLRDLRSRLVNLRGQIVELRLLVLLLRLRLTHLLVAEGLVRSLLRSLRLELLDHLRDQALDLRERILAEHGGRLNALRQQRELLVAVLLREALEEVQNVLLHLLRLRSGLGHRADLDKRVGTIGSGAGLLLENLLRGGERLKLVRAVLLRLRVLLRGRHALLLQVLEVRLVVREVLGRSLELTFRNCLGFLGRRLGRLRLRKSLLAERDGVLDLLLQHLEVERRVHLGLLRGGKLGLGLLEHVLKNAQDTARLRLVRGRVRRAGRLEFEVRIARALRRLEERLHLRLVSSVHPSRHDHGIQRIHDLVHRFLRGLALDEPGLGHLTLDDAVSALEHRHGFHQLLLELLEVSVLLLADLRRAREVLLPGGDSGAQLLDLGLSAADLRLLIRDGSLCPLDILLACLDRELQIHGIVMAHFREILEELVLRFTLFGNLRDETIEKLQCLLDGGDGTNREEQCKHTLHSAPLTKTVPFVKGP